MASLGVVAATLGPSIPASATPTSASAVMAQDTQLQSAKARAAALQAQLTAESHAMMAISDRYDLAQVRLQLLAAQKVVLDRKIAASKAAVAKSQALVRQIAVDSYESGGIALSMLEQLMQVGQKNYGVRLGYLQSVSSTETAALAQLQAAQRTLASQEAALAAQQRQAAAASAQLQAAANAAKAQIAAQHATMSQLNGTIGRLVAQDQAKAAAARRAAALAAAQAAAAAAARAAAAAAAARTAAAANVAQVAPAPYAPVVSSSGSGGSAPSASVPPPLPSASTAVQAALAQVGKPYQWGAAGPNSFDCSGLTMYAWGQAGISLLHYTVYQYNETVRISQSQLAPGDLVFYSFPGEPVPGHVAMYIGNGNIVSADTTGTPVRVESMYYDGTPFAFGRVTTAS